MKKKKIIRIEYDDREKLPWVVWLGNCLWCYCGTKERADLLVIGLQNIVDTYADGFNQSMVT